MLAPAFVEFLLEPAGDIANHADVYIKAAQHDSFKNTTKDFQIGNAGSFGNYLLNLDKDDNPNHDQLFIRKKIEEYNKNTSGKVKVKGPEFSYAKGSLTLFVNFEGYVPVPVPYTKINE